MFFPPERVRPRPNLAGVYQRLSARLPVEVQALVLFLPTCTRIKRYDGSWPPPEAGEAAGGTATWKAEWGGGAAGKRALGRFLPEHRRVPANFVRKVFNNY